MPKKVPNPLDLTIPYCPAEGIHAKQQAFLAAWQREVLFGGSAGPGKSVALAMGALQYVHIPRYSALLLRRTYRQLTQHGQLADILHTWLRGTDARWAGTESKWYFPSGATIQLGHLDSTRDLENYSGPEYQYIGWDELTQFPEDHYRFLFTRLRRSTAVDVPLRMRAATNPGGIGHDWVRRRFLQERDPERLYIPARLVDNPSLPDEYAETLQQLDPYTRAQMLYGDWDIEPPGAILRREWFRRYDSLPPRLVAIWDSWDLTFGGDTGTSWAVGQKWGKAGANLYLLAQVRIQADYTVQKRAVKALAEMRDTPTIVLEDAAAARPVTADLKGSLPGVILRKPKGGKTERLEAAAATIEAGNVHLPACAYVPSPAGYAQILTDELIQRLTLVPSGSEWDEADALSQAITYARSGRGLTIPAPVSVGGVSSWR